MNFDDAIAALTLTNEQLTQARDELAANIHKGLSQAGQQIKSLPAYLKLPKQNLSGEAFILDAGGTNVRAGHIKMTADTVEFINGPLADKTLMFDAQIPGNVSADEFFNRQASLLNKLSPPPEFNLGYCFSYPSENKPDGDASLINWTKNINVDDVIGQSARALLTQAITAQGHTALKTPVLNDTVTALIAGAWMSPDCDQYLGLIAGTGMNAAGFFRTTQITKLAPDIAARWGQDELMAVNLELGNFHPACLSHYDDELDADNPNDSPGRQRLEKAVSGRYLAKIYGRIVGREACMALPDGLDFDPEDNENTHAGHVTQLRRYQGPMSHVAIALINRSADLVAAALAGVIKAQDLPTDKAQIVGILPEGSLFWLTNGYPQRVEETLTRLIPDNVTVRIMQNDTGVDANFIGAATAALSM
ncbi:hexokinase [Formosimonas limnophila]|uniref:Hexokinase n=1 Tax=Formosimonas limnophila TaxID=1384487 RepID=A0A8J3CL17_9BURK|nr:hypothetical protein [Formosimonas limnophila]GHA64548.1 hexokinase [Formosimonas limnophila]